MLAWLFPWRKPLVAPRPMRAVPELEDARHAAETHDAISTIVTSRAWLEVERQGDQGGFLNRILVSSADLRDLTSQALDRTKR